MYSNRFKLLGVLALVIVFAVTMTACDLGDDDEVVEIDEIEDLEKVEITEGTSEDDAIDELADEVEINFTDGETVTSEVSWEEDNEDYDPEEPGTYTFEGDVTVR